MKKILLIIMLFFGIINVSKSYIGDCQIMWSNISINGDNILQCTRNYYTTYNDNDEKIINLKSLNSSIVMDFNFDSIKVKNKNFEKSSILLIETKYGKHIFSLITPILNNEYKYAKWNKVGSKYYKEHFKETNEYIKENNEYFGLYLDGQKILNYGLDLEETDYVGLKDYFTKNNIIVFGEDRNFYIEDTEYSYYIDGTVKSKKGNIFLYEGTIEKLDEFIVKLEKLNISQEILYKKIDKLYNKYSVLKGKRGKKIAEMLLYIRTELLIKELKKSGEIKTVDFYVDFE